MERFGRTTLATLRLRGAQPLRSPALRIIADGEIEHAIVLATVALWRTSAARTKT